MRDKLQGRCPEVTRYEACYVKNLLKYTIPVKTQLCPYFCAENPVSAQYGFVYALICYVGIVLIHMLSELFR